MAFGVSVGHVAWPVRRRQRGRHLLQRKTDPTDPVTINYYSSGYTDTGSDITFTGSPSSTDTAPSISELRDYYAGVDSDPLWPDASVVFGADFLTQIDVPSTGNYVFQFGADDGGLPS